MTDPDWTPEEEEAMRELETLNTRRGEIIMTYEGVRDISTVLSDLLKENMALREALRELKEKRNG